MGGGLVWQHGKATAFLLLRRLIEGDFIYLLLGLFCERPSLESHQTTPLRSILEITMK